MPSLSTFLIYILVTNFSPGPNNITAMSNGMRFGWRRTLPFRAGMFAGFATVMLLCGLANVALVGVMPQARPWLNRLGAAYMLWLAWRLLHATPAAEGAGAELATFRTGLLMQFLNVKMILYGVTVFSLFITPRVSHPLAVAGCAPLLAAFAFSATTAWAVGGNLFRDLYARYYRSFNGLMSLALLYTAGKSVWGAH